MRKLIADLGSVAGPPSSLRATGTEQPGKSEGKEAVSDGLKVWEETKFGIGMDAGPAKFYVISPPPSEGGQVAIERAKPLKIRGGQLEILLRLLADSEDGRTVMDADLIAQFKYVEFHGDSMSPAQALHDENFSQINPALEDLIQL